MVLDCRELKSDFRIVRDAYKRTFTSTYFEELELETHQLANGQDGDTVPSTADLSNRRYVDVCATTESRSASTQRVADHAVAGPEVTVARPLRSEVTGKEDTALQSPATSQRSWPFDFAPLYPNESDGPAGNLGRVKRKAVQTAQDATLARALQEELSHAGSKRVRAKRESIVSMSLPFTVATCFPP